MYSVSKKGKLDAPLAVTKTYLGTNYIENKFGKTIDLKNPFLTENLSNLVDSHQAKSKAHVVNMFSNPSKMKNSAQVDFNDKNLNNVRFVKINSLPSPRAFNTKYYVDEAISNSIDELTLVRTNGDTNFQNNKLTNINSITVISEATEDDPSKLNLMLLPNLNTIEGNVTYQWYLRIRITNLIIQNFRSH